MAQPSRKDPHNPLGAHRQKIPPILKNQGLTGSMQHSRAHEAQTTAAAMRSG